MKILSKIVVILIFPALLLQAAFSEELFLDVEESSYKENIISLKNKEIIQGYENGEFRPFNLINRAEFLKIVFKALDQQADSYQGNCFPDVKDQWFAPYVCKAKDLGIVKGYPDGLFRPEHWVNMAETLKISIEAFDFPIDELKEGENWFTPYVNFSHRNNIFSRYSYLPSKNVKREEVAFLIDNFLKIQKEEKPLTAERNVKSAGCSLSNSPENVPTKFMVNGVERSAITVIPQSYKPGEPISLVFAFHGRTNSNQMVKNYYGVEKAADGKAIFIYPAGKSEAVGYSWSDSGDKADDLRDYEFFDVMLEEFLNSYCISEDEIFVVGHSLGAWFTNSLACARGDKIRAVATLGGSRSDSECRGPVAVMQWHNPKDQQAPFSGALTTRDAYLKQNQCSNESVEVEPSWGNCVEYKGCYDDAKTIFCPHTKDYDWQGDFYPHNWPKDTGKEIWKFFESFIG